MKHEHFIIQLNDLLADWAIEVEGGNESALELYAFASAIKKVAEAYTEQEAIKKGAHVEAELYGKEGRALYGLVARASERTSYAYEYPADIAHDMAVINEAKKRYEESAKLACKNFASVTFIDQHGEEKPVKPAVQSTTYTVTLSKK